MGAERSEASRKRLYAAIERAMRAFPDMRVGQLIEDATGFDHDIFYVEDDLMVALLDTYVSTYAAKGGAS